jgi:hypothetical protein
MESTKLITEILIGQNIYLDFTDATKWVGWNSNWVWSGDTNTLYHTSSSIESIQYNNIIDDGRLYRINYNQIESGSTGYSKFYVGSINYTSTTGNTTLTESKKSIGTYVKLTSTFIGGIRDVVLESRELDNIDLSDNVPISLNYSLSDIRDISVKNADYSKTIIIPSTPNNDKKFGNAFNVNINPKYSRTQKTYCECRSNTINVMSGYAQVINVKITKDNKFYELNIQGKTKDLFIDLGDKYLSELDFSDYNTTLNTTCIANSINSSLSGSTHLLFPIIDYIGDLSDGKINSLNSPMCMDRFKPSLKVKDIWDKIWSEAGYTYDSEILNEDLFKRLVYLYTSGNKFWDNGVGVQTLYAYDYVGLTYNGSAKGLPVHFDKDYNSELSGYDKNNNYNISNLTTPENPLYTYYIPKDGYYQAQFQDFKCRIVSSTPCSVPVTYRVVRLTTGNYTTDSNNYINSIQYYADTLASQVVTQTETYGIYNTITSGKFKAFEGDIICCLHDWGDYRNLEYATYPKFNVWTYDNYTEGSTILANELLHKNIKCKDFILSISKMLNLYSEQLAPNYYKIETREDYYASGSTLDWSRKLIFDDDNYPIQISCVSDDTAKNFTFKYDEGEDYLNKLFKDNCGGYTFGTKEVITDNTNKTNKQDISLIFQPGITSDDNWCSLHPIVKLHQGNGVEKTEWKPTLGIFNVLDGSMKYKSAISGTMSSTVYPYAGNIYRALNPYVFPDDYDLSFKTESQMFSSTDVTNNNLYNLYWKDYIDSLISNKSKMVTAYFKLLPSDINKFRFSDKIRVDNGVFGSGFYIVNRIIDYDPTQFKPTKVELIYLEQVSITAHDLRVPMNSISGVGGNLNQTIQNLSLISSGNSYFINDRLPLAGGMMLGQIEFTTGLTCPAISLSGNSFVFDNSGLSLMQYNSATTTLTINNASGTTNIINKNVIIGNNNTYNTGSTGINLIGCDNCIIDSAITNITLIGTKNKSIDLAGYLSNSKVVSNTDNFYIGYKDHNIGIGYYSLSGITSGGTHNIALGNYSQRDNLIGDYNVGIGTDTLVQNTIGNYNVALGAGAGNSSTGSSNLFLGYEAGLYEVGSNRLYIATYPRISDTDSLIYGKFDTKEVWIHDKLYTDAYDVYGNHYLTGTTSSGTTTGITSLSNLTDVYLNPSLTNNDLLQYKTNTAYCYWKFNETSGISIADSSGNNRTGTTVNSPTFTIGKLNNCISLLSGSSQYVNYGDINNFERTDKFSFEFWINPNNKTGTTLFGIYNKTSLDYEGGVPSRKRATGIRIYGAINSSGGEIVFELNSNYYLLNRINISTGYILTGNTWHHIICTYDGSSNSNGLNLYLNGNLRTCTPYGTLTGSILTTENTYIGRRKNSAEDIYFDGKIDNFIVYDRKLSSIDVLERYSKTSSEIEDLGFWNNIVSPYVLETGLTNYSLTSHTHSIYSLTSHTHSNYLNLSGGTLTGSLTGTTIYGNVYNLSGNSYLTGTTGALSLTGLSDVILLPLHNEDVLVFSSGVSSYWTNYESIDINDVLGGTVPCPLGNTTVDTYSATGINFCSWDYIVYSGITNLRAGTIKCANTDTLIVHNETTTGDIGTTTGVTYDTDIVGGMVRLRCTTINDGWITKYMKYRF